MSVEVAFRLLGASNHTGKERENNDYYATEPKAAELLLQAESFSPRIWECACGGGHLSEVFKVHGYEVTSTDLIDRGFGIGGWISLNRQKRLTEILSRTHRIGTPKNL